MAHTGASIVHCLIGVRNEFIHECLETKLSVLSLHVFFGDSICPQTVVLCGAVSCHRYASCRLLSCLDERCALIGVVSFPGWRTGD